MKLTDADELCPIYLKVSNEKFARFFEKG